MNQYLNLIGFALICQCTQAIALAQSSGEAEQATQVQPEAASEQAPAPAAEPDPDQQALEEASAKAEKRLKEETEERQKFDELKLPENPTREQCENFVKEISRLSQLLGEQLRRSNAEVEKLSTLPVEHIDLLLRAMKDRDNNRIAFYAPEAVARYEPESYRELSLNRLAQEPAFIYLVARNGWYQDAKEPILATLKAVDPKVARFDPIWFQAFLEVAEPEHFPLIHEITLSFYDLENRLKLLETLPGYDFAKTIDACWEKAMGHDQNGGEPDAGATAVLRPYAIRSGKIEALDALIDQIDPNRPIGRAPLRSAHKVRITLRRHLAFNGTNEEIQAWYRTHRDQLVFNPFTQRFELPEN